MKGGGIRIKSNEKTKLGSLLALHDEVLSLRIVSFAIINLRGVSTKLVKNMLFLKSGVAAWFQPLFAHVRLMHVLQKASKTLCELFVAPT